MAGGVAKIAGMVVAVGGRSAKIVAGGRWTAETALRRAAAVHRRPPGDRVRAPSAPTTPAHGLGFVRFDVFR